MCTVYFWTIVIVLFFSFIFWWLIRIIFPYWVIIFFCRVIFEDCCRADSLLRVMILGAIFIVIFIRGMINLFITSTSFFSSTTARFYTMFGNGIAILFFCQGMTSILARVEPVLFLWITAHHFDLILMRIMISFASMLLLSTSATLFFCLSALFSIHIFLYLFHLLFMTVWKSAIYCLLPHFILHTLE